MHSVISTQTMNDLDLYFEFRCRKGLTKLGLAGKKEYEERLNYEIEVIKKSNFCGYFCIVADILDWARSTNIPVGPGRGSAAGSLAAHCLGITHPQIDPIKYGLLFERFLNPDRVSQPDIDIDISETRRNEVVIHIKETYGEDYIASIGTYGSMKAKGAIRDVARILGVDYKTGDTLSRLTLPPIAGKAQTLEACYRQVPELAAARKDATKPEGQILAWAERFEDRLRSFGTHASGYIISDLPVYNYVPLYPGKDGSLTTQFEMENIEEVGLIKFDLLALRALTTINKCCELIQKNRGIKVNIDTVPVDDEATYKTLQSGDTVGVFQIEGSQGIRDLVLQIRPTCLQDLSAIGAIYRPGPLGSPHLEEYLAVRAGKKDPVYLTPELEPVLKDTAGWLIYQEQLLEIAKKLAGYTGGEADELRKAVGKKKQELMDKHEKKFKQGIVNHGLDKEIGDVLWSEINEFAKYSFNRAHAICYGYIGYQMAYLKTYYPTEFMCSCLVSDSDEEDKVIKYINYCRDKGIKIMGPAVNKSQLNFSISGDAIRFGLLPIKNLGQPSETIIEERSLNGPYTDIINFIERIDTGKLNRKKLESMVYAGAFDEFGETRQSQLDTIANTYHWKAEYKAWESKQETYLKKIVAWQERQVAIEKWDQMTLAEKKQARLDGKKKPGKMKVPEAPQEPQKPKQISVPEMLDHEWLLQEKEMLGCYLTGHPLDAVTEPQKIHIEDIKEYAVNMQRVTLIAIPATVNELTTKKTQKRMAYMTLEDKSGTMEAVILPNIYEQYKDLVDIKTPASYSMTIEVLENDDAKVVKGRVYKVSELQSVKKALNEPVKIVIPISRGEAVAKTLLEHQGNDFHIQLTLQVSGGSLCDMGVFHCSGDRANLINQLRHL